MSDYISAELAATCAALGYYDGHKYYLDNHCLDVIKDLIKYLKRDDDSHTVRRFLGQTNLVQTDLIKIFVEHSDKLELWDVLLRLIINLTSPAMIIYNEQIPTEKTMHNLYRQVIRYSQGYKVALTDEKVWGVVSSRLGKILNIESTERGEENELIIDRILIFIRNVLQVPPDDDEKRADNDATVHDQVLFAFHSSGMVDLLLFIASNSSEQQYHMQILEIISLMLREQSARLLATSGLQRSTIEKEKDEEQLLTIRQKEIQEKIEKVRKYAGSRHSRFGGTYVVQNMKAIGENQLICHKPFQKIEALEFGQEKVKSKRPKNKLAMLDPKGERTSALSVRLFLKEFCVEFLNGAYNPVMRYARSCVIAGSHSEASEATCYLWALRFFMEFNRHYKFQVKYVSETISTEVFHLVQRQMELCYEMIVTDKKRIPLWSRRLHVGLKAYQELLHTLMAMDRSTDHGVRESSRVIKSNVFYVPEYRETILSQLLNYDELRMSRQYLIDLVTTAHIFLKMLEHFCGKGQRSVIVRKAKQRPRRRKQNKPAKKNNPPPTLDERWDDVGPELSAVMREGTIPEVVPFDATLDTPIDEQKSDAMKKIQKFLRQGMLEQAIGLIRAAREVWPENDCFGRTDIPTEEEFLALREIFFADLGDLVDWILEHLINQSRTRRGVIKKLKELYLIVNSKEIRAQVQKRLPKEWSEEEVQELTELWEQLKEDDDPVDLIFTGLRIKRPKPKIKEKLLELGLAKDRKELRKKRARKSGHPKSSWENQSDDNSDGNYEEVDEEARSAPHRNLTKKKTHRKARPIAYTDTQLSGLLKDVIGKNMREALEWIKESLQEALDDRDEESSEGVPLVPLTDYSLSAMDSSSFQKLLRAFGIVPPADEQETYWRIPAYMLTSTIRKRCDVIEDALAGRFPEEESQSDGRKDVESERKKENEDSEDDEDVLENIKKFFAPREPVPNSTKQQENHSGSSEREEFKSQTQSRKQRDGKAKGILREVETDSAQPVEETLKSTGGGSLRTKAFLDSSDSEVEVDVRGENGETADDSKRDRSDDSDTGQNPLSKKRRLLDSDEEEEVEKEKGKKDGPRADRAMISDDED